MGVTGLGVTGSWVLGTRCWVLGETCLMLEIDSWFSALVVTVPDEEDCWVSTFVETLEGKAGCWVVVFLMLESCFCPLPSSFCLPPSAFCLSLFIVISFVSWLFSVTGLVIHKTPAVAMVRRPATYQALKVVVVKVKKFLQASFEEMLFHSPDEGSTRKLLKLSL